MWIQCSRFVAVLALAMLIGCDDSDYQVTVTGSDAGSSKGDASTDSRHSDAAGTETATDGLVPSPDAGTDAIADTSHVDAGADGSTGDSSPPPTDARGDAAASETAGSDGSAPVDTSSPVDAGADDADDASASTTDGAGDAEIDAG